jgi:hypothetical protein
VMRKETSIVSDEAANLRKLKIRVDLIAVLLQDW